MKSSQIPSRILVSQPFASGTGAAYEAISNTSVANKPSFPDGFPSSFSAPASRGGNYIKRGQMNAIGRLASQAEFFESLGQIRTFDTDFANSPYVNGYPEGAILWFYNGGMLRPVVSLKDDNKVDFRINGVDGVNWKYANSSTDNQMFPSWDRRAAGSIFGTITSAPSTKGWSAITGWCQMPHDGWLRMAFNLTAPTDSGIQIVMIAGNSSGEQPNVDETTLQTGIDPTDRTCNFEVFNLYSKKDVYDTYFPMAEGTKVRVFIYIPNDSSISSFRMTDYVYSPAT